MKQILSTLILAASIVTACGQATVMNSTNTLRILKPEAAAFWSSNRADILAGLSLDLSINGGEPNGAGATIHWSQLLGVPELGGGGGGEGESNFIASVTADFDVLARQLSLTNATGTGAFVRASVLDSYLTSAAGASLFQPLDPGLTALAQGDGGAITNLPASALTGTVPDERLSAAIVRTNNALTITVPTASPGTSNTVAASTEYVDRAVAAGGGGGGGGGMTIVSNWFARPVGSSTNTVLQPQPIAEATTSSWTPDFSAGRVHQVTMSGNLTLSAPTGTTEDMLGQTFLLILVQDSTGGRSVTPATNYLSGLEVTGLGVSTNAGSRSYVTVLLRRTNVLDVLGSLSGYAP